MEYILIAIPIIVALLLVGAVILIRRRRAARARRREEAYLKTVHDIACYGSGVMRFDWSGEAHHVPLRDFRGDIDNTKGGR